SILVGSLVLGLSGVILAAIFAPMSYHLITTNANLSSLLPYVLGMVGAEVFAFFTLLTVAGERDKDKKAQFTYETLLKALEEGQQLIIPDGKEVFDTEWGKVDLKRLNDITNYRGRDGLFYLARDFCIYPGLSLREKLLYLSRLR
ncbi:unnamed protein product, partial [marine sediment metagenome]